MKTTLNKIRSFSPCQSGWEKLLRHLGKKADDEPLDLKTIYESNGFDDALWCLRAVEGRDREIRLFAVWCARQVQHLMTDERSKAALEVAEKYANGETNEGDLRAAYDAAYDAACAACAAADAAAAAAAAYDAYDAAVYAAAYAADAYAAAIYAAVYAAYAAYDAAYAADAADAAAADARKEMRRVQEEEFIRFIAI